MTEKWEYLETAPAPDAPISDNPSGLYCAACRACGVAHCSTPEHCGEMRRMKVADAWVATPEWTARVEQEFGLLTNAALRKKVVHLERTIRRGIRTGWLQRNIDMLAERRRIAAVLYQKRSSESTR